MRNMLLAALALASQLPSTVADACGGYPARPPRMFQVTAHFGRTFIQLGGAVPDADKLDWWEELMTYDHTKVAPAPALAEARTFTFVGGEGVRVASTAQQVFLDPAWEGKGPMTALEVATLQEPLPRIAIAGTHDAAWSELKDVEVTAEDRAWAESPGFSPALDSHMLTAAKVDADLELITAYSLGHTTTYVRWGKAAPVGGYEGTPRGVVTVDGVRYVVFIDGNTVRPVQL